MSTLTLDTTNGRSTTQAERAKHHQGGEQEGALAQRNVVVHGAEDTGAPRVRSGRVRELVGRTAWRERRGEWRRARNCSRERSSR